jgi:hypothetical protein
MERKRGAGPLSAIDLKTAYRDERHLPPWCDGVQPFRKPEDG